MLTILIVISLVWLLVAAVVVALCGMAARGDAEPTDGPARTIAAGAARRRIAPGRRGDRFATHG